jgi:ribose 5-phosphate isomerase B
VKRNLAKSTCRSDRVRYERACLPAGRWRDLYNSICKSFNVTLFYYLGMQRFLDFARNDRSMKISLGTDHAGFCYKEKVKELLTSLGHEVKDFGTFSEEPVDYPVFIRPAAEAVASGECERGIVFGGSGNGEAMVANKVHGVRCALCWSEESARLSRQHNDANVLSIGQRMISEELALNIVRIWLETGFDGGRHERRVAMLNAM